MKRDRLFDVDRREVRHGTTTALVAVETVVCPSCGSDTVRGSLGEPALFRHGGYGATRETITDRCTSRQCDWKLVVSVTEVSPRG
jgi:hypothetical protein